MDKISIVNLLVGGVLPLIVAFVTKETWAGWVKGLVLAALSAAGGVGTDFLHSSDFDLSVSAWGAGLAFVFAVAAHVGVYKDTTLHDLLAKALYRVPAAEDALAHLG
ncbi:hypothetical protein [Streptomyces sp. NPDC004528]|uniref:hypothetical protein n=1 Tax=Streptomyces sp. NPDC004528 TaxID=3154550 RepID=UPI0033B0E3CF